MFEYVKDDGTVLSIKDFICDQFNDEINEEVTQAIKSNYYYGISLLEKVERDPLSNALYKEFEYAINMGKIRLNKKVRDFLCNGAFPLIITTFGFPLIEKELGLKEDSIEWYNPNRRNDLPIVRDDNSMIVYHIFGGRTHSSWAYNEQSLLKFLHSLQSGDYGAKNLSYYLRKHGNKSARNLLVIGASLPDWLFRFFVYPMYEEELKDVKGYWLSLDRIEKELDFFLDRNNYTGQTNLRKNNRIDNIISEATLEKKITDEAASKIRKIFVSYKREEANTPKSEEIQRVIDILKKQGAVWLDTQKVSDGGNPYWAHIKNAVQQCDIFVPIVTMRYLEEYRGAVDITQYAANGINDAEKDNANDESCITQLKPVIREAYYAIAFRRLISPIVIYDDNTKLNEGKVEAIAKDPNDERNLPLCIFGEHTLLLHNDNNPVFFNLPQFD